MKICKNKSCKLAGIEQPLRNFSERLNSRDGYEVSCKPCRAAAYEARSRRKISGEAIPVRETAHIPRELLESWPVIKMYRVLIAPRLGDAA